MLFQIYGATAATQLLGWLLVFCGLIALNEIGRRTKIGGIVLFVALPLVLTVYFIAIHLGAFPGNQTMGDMDGWFHYFKLYAADIGCVGFMMIKYGWGIGKKKWFKWFPWFIVAANILIAVVSDLESALAACKIAGGIVGLGGNWWASNEGVLLYGGWWNVVNALAGIINIFCMTGCINLYTSNDKNKSDMLWPDMTIWFIISYDIWNFEYTYLNLPTHSWYCGFALLLAPTFANALWNKGGWIQNRAHTLAIWCMFAQVFPLFQLCKTFSVLPSVYGGANGRTALDLYDTAIALYNAGEGKTAAVNQAVEALGITANPTAQGVVALAALFANVVVIAVIIKRAKAMGKNPYSNDIWAGTKDYDEAMARAAV